MKFNFKKISAITTSVLMIGMTMGVAAAASYPAPFVSGGSADVAIVYGTGDGVSDLDRTAGVGIQTDLSAMTTTGATGSTVTGDSIMLERSSNKFNIGNNMSSFYARIDDSELSTVLADGVYSNDAHDDFDYTQDIILGVDLQLTHFKNTNFNDNKPIVGFDMNNNDLIMNYTLKFTDDAQGTDSAFAGIVNTYLPLLGEEYYVLSVDNTVGTGLKITLLNAAASGELAEGESISLTTDDGSYDVSVAYIDDTNVKLTINGETTDSLGEGETQKLSDGSYVGVKEVSFQGVTGGASNVAFSIGSGKLVLENTKEVELNSDKLSKAKYSVENSEKELQHEIKSYINNVSTNLDSIVLQWKIKDDTWIAPGTELMMPGFESIKISMGGFITDKAEVTNLNGDSNTFTLSAPIQDGTLDLDVFYYNSSSSGIAGLGTDSENQLVTSEVTGTTGDVISISLNETLSNYFVVTWMNAGSTEAETFAYTFEVEENSDQTENKTILTNIITGSDVTIDNVGEYTVDGNIKFTSDVALEENPSDSYATINITAASSGNVSTHKLVTVEGMEISLPVINATGHLNETIGNYQINIDSVNQPTSWKMRFSEEDRDDTIDSGNHFNVTIQADGTDGFESSSTVEGATFYETEKDSDNYVAYISSDLATMIEQDRPTNGLNDLDITYHGTEAYAEVYVTEAGATLTTVGGTSSLGEVLVMDTEVSTVSTKNLIIIGGSCINSAAATVLGGAKCGAAFTDATGIGSGEFLIKGISGSGITSKLVLVVAGYESADTTNAATYLRTQPVDTSKSYKGTSSTSATVIVE